MGAVILDTHVVHWWSSDPGRVSAAAAEAIEASDELVVASITWYELALMAHHERIAVSVPVRSWLEALAANLRTVAATPAIADTAAALSSTFPGDPADRLIFATAVESGLKLVTKDRRIREHPYPRAVTVW